MRTKHTDQRLAYTGDFECVKCAGEGVIPDEFGHTECDECDGNGIVECACELRFDIEPGVPASGHGGPPEDWDEGCGPDITMFSVFIADKDETKSFLSLDEADAFIRDKWSQIEVVDESADRSVERDYSDGEDDHG